MSKYYDARGRVWNKVRKKRTPGYPPKSDNQLERKETVGIGLFAKKLGLFPSKPVGAFKGVRVAADPGKRAGEAPRGEKTASKA